MDGAAHESQLHGRYSRMIQIYLAALLMLFVGVPASGQSQPWLAVLVVIDMGIVIPILALYSKSIVVSARAGRLDVRQRAIDVTGRVKNVQHRDDRSLVIRLTCYAVNAHSI